MQDVVKKSGVRDHLRTNKHVANIGGDVPAALDAKVKALLDEAAERADANGRNTLKARDI